MEAILERWNDIKINNKLAELDDKLAAIGYDVLPGSTEYVKVMKECSILSKKIAHRDEIDDRIKDLQVLKELAAESPQDFLEEYEEEKRKMTTLLDELEIETLFKDKYDYNGAYITVNAGSGGLEAEDWAGMLSRMYARWAKLHNFDYEFLDDSRTLRIKGEYVYGRLKGEHGVHRLVRVSPFDSKSRRHTSFAAVEVIPIIDDDTEVSLNWNDVEMQSFRSGGPGGQYQNTTDSGVRLIHKPTGIVVESRQERSQIQNRAICESMLISKLVMIEEEKKKKEIDELKGEQTEAGWGHSIRSYVFMPYQLVKDNRTGFESGRVEDILNGEIDDFIKSYLTMN